MPDRAWKQTERRIAAMLGGERVPVSGRGRGDAPDVAHDLFSIECKHRRTLPGWLLEAVAQAEAACVGGKVPLVVLHRAGDRHADALAVLRLRDVTALVGGERRKGVG